MTEWAGVGASWEEGLPHPLIAFLEFRFPKSSLILNVYGNPLKVALQMGAEAYSCKHFDHSTIGGKKQWFSSLLPVCDKAKLISGWGE